MQFNLDYFYGNEAGPSRFYRMPKALFDGNLSLEAATLYSLMLDRVGLSVKNGWTDGLGRIFIYFVQKDVQKFLRCGHNRATAFMRELERFGLIKRKRQGLGKPAMIYVKNFSAAGTMWLRKTKPMRLWIRLGMRKRSPPFRERNPPIRLFFLRRRRQSILPRPGSPECPQKAVWIARIGRLMRLRRKRLN